MTSQFYNNNAIALAQQYLSKSFDEVHASWSKFSPAILLSKIIEKPNARILDIGAGAGRDVKHLTQLTAKTHQSNNTENNVKIMAVEINTAVERGVIVVCPRIFFSTTQCPYFRYWRWRRARC